METVCVCLCVSVCVWSDAPVLSACQSPTVGREIGHPSTFALLLYMCSLLKSINNLQGSQAACGQTPDSLTHSFSLEAQLTNIGLKSAFQRNYTLA